MIVSKFVTLPKAASLIDDVLTLVEVASAAAKEKSESYRRQVRNTEEEFYEQ
jgi:hypothetical protein